MTSDQKPGQKQINVDANYLMRLMVGGIVKTTNEEMSPEMLQAIATAAQAFAALQSTIGHEERIKALEKQVASGARMSA